MLALYGFASVFSLTAEQRALRPTFADAATTGRLQLRILSMNLYSANQDHAAVCSFIAAENPDVLVVTELTTRWLEVLEELLPTHPYRRHQVDDAGNFGIGVWSRHPLSKQILTLENVATTQFLGILDVPRADGTSEQVRLVGVHPLPPVNNRYLMERQRVFDLVAEEVRSGDMPTIVAGDFNASRFTPSFGNLCQTAHLKDAGFRCHFGHTWPSGAATFVIGVRIDHVLVSPDWHVRDFRIGPDVGSDHYPVTADLILP